MSDLQEPSKKALGKKSTFAAQELASDRFVESCGAILFDLSNPQDKKICIVKPSYAHEWLLAKGRRNHGESRKDAAIREVREETGFRCKIFPVTMPTHTTPPDAHADISDSTRVYEGLSEPFWCTIRQMKKPIRTKIIWWYVAVLEDEDKDAEKLPGEEKFEPRFVKSDKALEMLTFQTDRDVVAKAIELVDHTLFGKQEPAKAPKKEKLNKKAKAKAREKAIKDPETTTGANQQEQQSKSAYVVARKRKTQDKEPKHMVEAAHSRSHTMAWRSEGITGSNDILLDDPQLFRGDGSADDGNETNPNVGKQSKSTAERANINQGSTLMTDEVKVAKVSRHQRKKQKLREEAAQKQASNAAKSRQDALPDEQDA